MKNLNAVAHVYAIIISQTFKKNNILLFESLSLELTFY